MVRRTKADAELTRHSLLDAAERLFHAHGVSGTSLAQIAAEAGVTRGAIYWHFKDKADLFNAMMERVTLPLEGLSHSAAHHPDGHALAHLRQMVSDTLLQMVRNAQMRRVFDITRNRAEYVDDMHPMRERLARTRTAFIAHTRMALEQEAQRQGRPLLLPPEQAAWVLNTQVDGIFYLWMMNQQAFDLPTVGLAAFDTVVRGLGLAQVDMPEADAATR